MPVINEINISLIESVETVSVIHFVIIVNAIKCAPDENKTDNKNKTVKDNGKSFEFFHKNKCSCTFLIIIAKIGVEVKVESAYNKARILKIRDKEGTY